MTSSMVHGGIGITSTTKQEIIRMTLPKMIMSKIVNINIIVNGCIFLVWGGGKNKNILFYDQCTIGRGQSDIYFLLGFHVYMYQLENIFLLPKALFMRL